MLENASKQTSIIMSLQPTIWYSRAISRAVGSLLLMQDCQATTQKSSWREFQTWKIFYFASERKAIKELPRGTKQQVLQPLLAIPMVTVRLSFSTILRARAYFHRVSVAPVYRLLGPVKPTASLMIANEELRRGWANSNATQNERRLKNKWRRSVLRVATWQERGLTPVITQHKASMTFYRIRACEQLPTSITTDMNLEWWEESVHAWALWHTLVAQTSVEPQLCWVMTWYHWWTQAFLCLSWLPKKKPICN